MTVGLSDAACDLPPPLRYHRAKRTVAAHRFFLRKHPGGVSLLFVVALFFADAFPVCVNSSPFRGFDVGEVRFLGASGGYRQGDKAAEMTFKFAVSPNAWNIQVGGMTIPFKYGWDYLWVRWADLKRGNVTVKVPIEAYVEKVYQGLNFYSLGIG